MSTQRHEFSQVHGPVLPQEMATYSYHGLPWIDSGKLAIYMLTFTGLFVFARYLVHAFF